MIKFTKKLAFAASLVTMCAGSFDAHASDDGIQAMDVSSPSLQRLVLADAAAPAPHRHVYEVKELHGVFQDMVPKDLLKSFFVEAFERGADPRAVERVCKTWYNILRYQIPRSGAPKVDLAGIAYETKLNDIFMEDYMKLYLDGIISRGLLYYKKDSQKERAIGFSDFQNGAANLAHCEGEDMHMVYTNSMERLRLVRGANENKLVTFFGTFHKARELLPAKAKVTVSDVVVIWKWGNNTLWDELGNVQFDYLIIKPSLLCLENMFEIWKKSGRGYGRCSIWAGRGDVFMFVCEPKLGQRRLAKVESWPKIL